MNKDLLTALSSLVAGIVFAIGLGIAGMTRPAKVIAFLDVTGDWDPSLALVMVGAIGIYGLAFRLVQRREAPILSPRFMVPTRRDLTPRLIAGSALFGLGWGLAGYCPGPALTSVVTLAPGVLVMVGAMTLGMVAVAQVEEWLAARRDSAPVPTPTLEEPR